MDELTKAPELAASRGSRGVRVDGEHRGVWRIESSAHALGMFAVPLEVCVLVLQPGSVGCFRQKTYIDLGGFGRIGLEGPV